MWILRWILVACFIVFILWFSLLNQRETVGVNLFGWESPEIPLYLALFIAFVIGMFVWLLISAFQIFQLQAELRTCKKGNRKLQEELDALRNLPLEESGEELQQAEPPPEIG